MTRKILFALLLSTSLVVNAQDAYYYYKGQKVDLVVDKNYLNIITDNEFQKSSLSNLNNINLETDNSLPKVGNAIKLKAILSKQKYLETVNALKQNPNIKHVLPYFERNGSAPISISDVFYVKLKDVGDTTLLKNVANEKNVQVIKQVPYLPHWYILSLNNSINGNTLDVSNYFYETGYFDDIDPAFLFDFKTNCTNDPLFGQLWGLNNGSSNINVCSAWAITKGAGIKVAVVDQGIDATHNDLAANLSPLSFDAKSGTSPSVFISGNYHGTHVAGTVAAIGNNNLQVVGVAPEAKIIRVSHSLSANSTTSAELASGISWAWQNGADVITNSWGDQGGLYYNQLHSTILENAITAALTQGRGGKGSVVVFASGNWGSIDYPASFHNDILTVGAINASGTRAIFSSTQSSGYGTQLDM